MIHTVPLNRNRDFQKMYRRGGSVVGGCIVVYCRPNRSARTRLGLTVSSKLGCAVLRNRMKRRIKESYRLMEAGLKPGFDIVIVARARSRDVPFTALQRELREALFKLQAVKR